MPTRWAKLRSRNLAKRPKSSTKARWAVLISGRGSNLAALLEVAAQERAQIISVYSSSRKAYGMKLARRAGVPVRLIPRREKKLDYSALSAELKAQGISHIFLAGFMRLIPTDFVSDWADQMLNLHPSLLPAYPGLNSLEKAFADSADIGCTVHIVVPEVDAGPVLIQRRVIEGAKTKKMQYEDVERRVHLIEQISVSQAIERWKKH